MRSSIPDIALVVATLLCIHSSHAQTQLRPICPGHTRPFFWDEWTRLRQCPAWSLERAQQFCVAGFADSHIAGNWLCPRQHCSCYWYANEDPLFFGRIDAAKAKSGLRCQPRPIDPALHTQAASQQDQQIEQTAEIAWYCLRTCFCTRPTRKQWIKIREDHIRDSFSSLGIDNPQTTPRPWKEGALEDCSDAESVGSSCSVTCQGQADCESGNMCKVQSHPLNSVPVRFGGFLAFCKALQMTRSRPRLAGRSLEDGNLCACNATYIAEACCGSPYGLVWDVPAELEIRIDKDTVDIWKQV